MYDRGSRYEKTPVAIYTDANGKQTPYTLLRPIPDAFVAQEYVVRQNDRLDRIADRFYRDSQQFWRLCDANQAMRPDDLTATPGRRLRVTLP